MSDDIVKRLREAAENKVWWSDLWIVAGEAADEIERLRADLATERERAVEKLAIWREQSDADERMIYKLREALVRTKEVLRRAGNYDCEYQEDIDVIDAVLKETE